MTDASQARTETQKEHPAPRRRHRKMRPALGGQLVLDLDV